MTQIAALAYGLLASFVLASVSRNKRERRANPAMLTLFSWAILSFSAASGLLLLGYVGWKALSGAA